MIPGSANPLLLATAAGAGGGYEIERSLRFNSSDSAYLSRTPASSSNRKTWTWAGWVKRGSLSGTQWLFECSTSATYYTIFALNSDAVYFYDQSNGAVTSTALYRDPGAWMHLVLAVDTSQATASNRVKMYVNGAQITALSGTAYPTQNADTGVNSATLHSIGARFDGAYSLGFNGYLADVHFIDGQALDPTSFGEFDTNGVWQPIAYTGSYGTNGFYLPFSDNSTAAALGTDTSGNSNTWTVNNISVAAGAGNDSLVDSPTNYGTDTGAGGEVRGNYATLNPIDNPEALVYSNGNLDATVTPIGTYDGGRANFGLTSGKWYFELVSPNADLTDDVVWVGLAKSTATFGTSDSNFFVYYNYNGNKVSGTSTAYGATWVANDVVGVAFDADAGKLWFSKNGTWQASGDPEAGTNEAFSGLTSGPYFPCVQLYKGTAVSTSFNFGQRPFAYTAPSGFKALCTTNLAEPTIADGSTAMDVALYTGNGSTQTISGLNFDPDLVWIKGRSGATDHALYDTVRTATKQLESNTTTAETTEATGLTAFATGGFSLGALAQVNTSSATYAAWTWDAGSSTVTNTEGSITSQVRANASAGFSVVTYTGNGTLGATFGHGLNIKPGMVIVKNRTTLSEDNWTVWHDSLGVGNWMYLNLTSTEQTGPSRFNSTDPSSTLVTLGNSGDTNRPAHNYVCYAWTPVSGYSSFGSYTGNSIADGPFVYTGFRPRWVLIKQTDSVGSWYIYDSSRGDYNFNSNVLYPNLSNEEVGQGVGIVSIDMLSNGFKPRTASGALNASGGTYAYACFSEHPFATSRAR